jgi:hypothetical protein
VGLTTTAGGVLNNWGYSKLTRGDYTGAERLFIDALRHEPRTSSPPRTTSSSPRRAAQLRPAGHPMTQAERAQLLYTLASRHQAERLSHRRSLLEDAIETSPTPFEEAVRALEALGTA